MIRRKVSSDNTELALKAEALFAEAVFHWQPVKKALNPTDSTKCEDCGKEIPRKDKSVYRSGTGAANQMHCLPG